MLPETEHQNETIRLHEKWINGIEKRVDAIEKNVNRIPWILFITAINFCLNILLIFISRK